MKKILFVAVLALASIMAYAQPRAIGVNLGPWSSISYEHGFGQSNMLDVAANVILPLDGKHTGVGGHVTYDWIDPFGAAVPWNNQGEWHWYMGVGGAGGYPCAENFYPTRAFTKVTPLAPAFTAGNVHFYARFGKREIRGTETGFSVFIENDFNELVQKPL